MRPDGLWTFAALVDTRPHREFARAIVISA